MWVPQNRKQSICFLLRNSSVYTRLPITHSVRPPKFCINYGYEMLLGGLHISKSIWQQQANRMNYSKLERERESTKTTKTVLFPLALEHQGKKNVAWPREGPSCVVNWFTYLGLRGWCIETKFPIKQTRTTISQPRTNCVSSVELLGAAYYKELKNGLYCSLFNLSNSFQILTTVDSGSSIQSC